MNSTQRKYLCDKITEKVKAKVKDLESRKVEIPSIAAYMMHEILSDRFEIKPNDQLRTMVISRAKKGLSNPRPDDFMGDTNSWGSHSGNNKNKVVLSFEEFFVLPESYQTALNNAKAINENLRQQIRDLNIQAETLETRIMLASDKTLQTMINEVDDMGDISLVDTKLKLLS